MPYGYLSSEQEATLTSFIDGKVIHDLGAGDLVLSCRLIALGASKVIAVDKKKPSNTDPKVFYTESSFAHFTDPVSVAFVSWPPLYDCFVEKVTQRAEMVIYLGKNTDGFLCGSLGFFNNLLRRRLLAYVPDRKNVLLVAGESGEGRQLTGDEYAAIDALRKESVPLDYLRAEQIAERDKVRWN